MKKVKFDENVKFDECGKFDENIKLCIPPPPPPRPIACFLEEYFFCTCTFLWKRSFLHFTLSIMDGPFRVSAAILGIKMQTLMATVALLQLFDIFPNQGSCSKCSNNTSSDIKADGNYIYWQSVTSRLETSRYRDFSQFFESISLGLENFGLEKKSRYRSRKYLVSKKSLGIGLENI